MEENMGEYKVDMNAIDSPVRMLEVMAFTLGSLAGTAKIAAEQFMADSKSSASASAQLMISTASTVGAFFWPLPSRRKKLTQAYPLRGEDLQALFGLDSNRLESLKLIRDSMIHLDERIEEFWLTTPDGQLTMWAVTETPVAGGNFMSWNPKTEMFSFLDHSMSVVFTLFKYIDVPDSPKPSSDRDTGIVTQVTDL
jgi:hypothetical protein